LSTLKTSQRSKPDLKEILNPIKAIWDQMAIRQTRGDKKIKNIDLPAPVRDKYREDATLRHVLDKEREVSLSQLRKKYSDKC
jgi:hypothetical protein